MKTIMLTGAGAPGMPGILKCLSRKRDQIRLIGVDADSSAPSRKEFDGFYTVPKAKESGYLPRMLELCKKESIDLLVPVVTRELEILSENGGRFAENGIKVAVMESEKIRIANNKGLLYKVLTDNGIPVPEYSITENTEQTGEAIDRIAENSIGVVIKPVEGNGSRGVRLIDFKRSYFDAFFNQKPDGMYTSKEELIRILSEKPVYPLPLMVMEYLPGKEYSVDIVARNGTVQAAVCRVGLTVVSSNQTSSMVVDEPGIIEMCSKVTGILKLSGNIGFDLKEDDDGKVYILEINPRLTGGIVTCLAAGANMPWLGIQSWFGEKVQQPQLTYGVRMQRYWNETFFNADDEEMSI